MTTVVGTPPGVTASGYRAAPPFDPLTLTWRHVWWADGVRMKARGYGNAAPVGTWPDEVGSADMVQATSTLQPLYASSVARLKGKAGVDPDGVDDYMKFTPAAISQPWSAVIICAPQDLWGNKAFFDAPYPGPAIEIPGGNRLQHFIAGSAWLDGPSYSGNYNARLFGFYANAASSTQWVDGTTGTTGNPGAAGWAAQSTWAFTQETLASTGFIVDPVAFLAIADGDIRTQPNWAAFVAWSKSYYGTP